MSRRILVVLSVLAGLAGGSAYGSEAGVKQAFQGKFPTAAVESVTRTPFAGIYEVVFDGQIAYTDDNLNFVFFGNLYDMRGGAERNLTHERGAQLTAQTLRKSTELAIKRVRGNGKRVIYTFEDPNCGFCKELQKELVKVTDVTIYTFLWPILSQDSVDKSRAVWCAKDRGKAWDELMSHGTAPQNEGKCNTPIEKNMQLAQRFGVRGTPAIFFADGRMNPGVLPADKLEQAMNSAASR